MPQLTAITLDIPAGTPAPSVSAARTAALSRVVPTETKAERVRRCTSGCPRAPCMTSNIADRNVTFMGDDEESVKKSFGPANRPHGGAGSGRLSDA